MLAHRVVILAYGHVSAPGKGSGHTLGGSKVNDIAILLEHVDLFNRLDWLHVELLQ